MSDDVLRLKVATMFGIRVRMDMERAELDRWAAWRQARIRPVDPPAQPMYIIEGSCL